MRATVLGLVLLAGISACKSAMVSHYVYYAAGADRPRSGSDEAEINAAIGVLRQRPAVNAGVIGYASAEGDPTANRELSFRRAAYVREQMVRAGIPPSRIQLAARGHENPAASNATEQGRAQNRRVEIFLYEPSLGTLQSQYGVHLEVQAR